MTDLIDQAQRESDLHLSVALARREPTTPCIGRCNWCSHPVGVNVKFCDKDCSDDWHQHRRMNGGW